MKFRKMSPNKNHHLFKAVTITPPRFPPSNFPTMIIHKKIIIWKNKNEFLKRKNIKNHRSSILFYPPLYDLLILI
jgi:hypothetical protein